MAWNTPGSSGPGSNPSGPDGRRPQRPRKPGGGLDTFLDAFRGLFGGGGGGTVWRWVAVAFGLWLVFTTFVLVTEQERGVVLRFGQFARVMQPGPHFKAPWPIETVTKVNATQSNAYSETVPVFTRDNNMVNVEINVPPRKWVEAQYGASLVHWTDMPRGGHFAALEQPELLVDDVRAFFRKLKQ